VTWLATSGRLSVVGLARLGYLAKGLVFAAIGILALLALFGFAEGQVTGSDGAIHIVGRRLPGRLGFGLLAVGLSAHVFWRLYQVLIDPDERGTGFWGLVQRAGLLCSAGLYTSMLLVTLSAVTDLASVGHSGKTAAAALSLPGGRWLLGMVGLGVMLTGGFQLWRAWAQPFRDKWIDDGFIARFHGPMAWMSSYGIAARSVIFFLLGWSMVRAGWFSSSDEVTDVASAMWRISTETHGQILLGLMATGFLFYGLYCGLNAAFRKIRTT
jgi:hypothetical protein